MADGKEQKFRGLPEPGGFVKDSRSFKYFMTTTKETAMCNDINSA